MSVRVSCLFPVCLITLMWSPRLLGCLSVSTYCSGVSFIFAGPLSFLCPVCCLLYSRVFSVSDPWLYDHCALLWNCFSPACSTEDYFFCLWILYFVAVLELPGFVGQDRVGFVWTLPVSSTQSFVKKFFSWSLPRLSVFLPEHSTYFYRIPSSKQTRK